MILQRRDSGRLGNKYVAHSKLKSSEMYVSRAYVLGILSTAVLDKQLIAATQAVGCLRGLAAIKALLRS